MFEAAPEAFHKIIPSYAWYMRVADVPKFLNHIAPVLEGRLAQSALNGFIGRDQGDGVCARLQVEDHRGEDQRGSVDADDSDHAMFFPPYTFLQLLFGRRSLSELRVYCIPTASCRMRPRRCSKCCSPPLFECDADRVRVRASPKLALSQPRHSERSEGSGTDPQVSLAVPEPPREQMLGMALPPKPFAARLFLLRLDEADRWRA